MDLAYGTLQKILILNESCQKTTKLTGWKKIWGQGQGHRDQSFGVNAKVLSKGMYEGQPRSNEHCLENIIFCYNFT